MVKEVTMPIKKKKGETCNQCVTRAMHENYGKGTAARKRHTQSEAIAISFSQCGCGITKGKKK